MLYDLHAREPHATKRDAAFYLKHAEPLLASRERLVLFVEPELVERVAAARRVHDPRLERTCLVASRLEDQPLFAARARVEAAFKAGRRAKAPDGRPIARQTPLYVLLTASKFSLLQQAVRLNPFRTSHVYWVDLALWRDQRAPLPLHELKPDLLRGEGARRVRVTFRGAYGGWALAARGGDTKAAAWYDESRQITPGGMFGGPAAALARFCADAEREWVAHSLTTSPGTEEPVMARIVMRDWKRVDVAWGGYDTLLQAHNLARTLEAARELRAAGPGAAEALRQLVICELARGRSREARAALREVAGPGAWADASPRTASKIEVIDSDPDERIDSEPDDSDNTVSPGNADDQLTDQDDPDVDRDPDVDGGAWESTRLASAAESRRTSDRRPEVSKVSEFVFFPRVDSAGSDMGAPVAGDMRARLRRAAADPAVVCLNSNGHLKTRVRARSEWQKWTEDASLGLYVRRTHAPPGGRDIDRDGRPVAAPSRRTAPVPAPETVPAARRTRASAPIDTDDGHDDHVDDNVDHVGGESGDLWEPD